MKKKLRFILIISLTLFFLQESFIPQSMPLLDSNLRDIFFIDKDYGWVVGSNGIVILTTNGGEDWIVTNTPYSEYFASIFFTNRDFGWTVTTYNDRVYMTTDGGNTWVHINTITGSNISLQDVFFVNDSAGFICGSDQSIHKTTDYGYNWQDITGNFYGSSVIEFINENYGLMGAFNSIKKTTNGGSSWTSIDLLTYAFFVTEISSLNQNNIFLVGYGWDNIGTSYEIFISTNNGGSSLYHKSFNTPLWDVHFDSPSTWMDCWTDHV